MNVPNELPPLGPRPDVDAGGLPPLRPTGQSAPVPPPAAHDERTREIPRPEPPRHVEPLSAPKRTAAPTPPGPTPVAHTARRGGAVALIAAAAIAGGVAGHFTGGRDEATTVPGTPITLKPIANENELQTAIRKVQSSVVEVKVNLGFGGSQGSGVIMADSGLVVTNNHVIDGATGKVEIVTAAGQSIPATIVAKNAAEDLAVLRPDSSAGPGVALSDDTSGPPSSGTSVFAIGSPFGLQNTVTAGVVSAYRNENGMPLIQFDAPVNPGNSGGGLFDLAGAMVGVPTSIRSPVEGNVGIAFAVPASRVRAILATVK